MQRIDFGVLLFFVGLFMLVGGLEAEGVFEPLVNVLAELGNENPVLLGVVIIWVVVSLSAVVDNVPVTIAIISLLEGLRSAGVDVSALWWAVVLGAGFGGNATSIGSGANLVIVSLSQRTYSPITPAIWSRKGLPFAIATTIVGSILFVVAFPFLGR